MAEIKLNNADAYRFLTIKTLPILTSAIEANGCKYVKPTSTAKGTTADVVFKFKDQTKNLVVTSPTLFYPGSKSIAVSLHKMMCSKNILFIKDNAIYIISVTKLLSVWNNNSICTIDKRSYQDGLGEKAQLSRINIDWLVENADMTFAMSEELAAKYNDELAKIC